MAKRKRTGKPQIRHGLSYHPLYATWKGMVRRCTDPTEVSYRWYGARGITVFEGWIRDPGAFFDHIGPKPGPRHSLDRINNNGNYEPGNVRWATVQQQADNTYRRRPVPGHSEDVTR